MIWCPSRPGDSRPPQYSQTKSLQCSSRKATMIDLFNNKFYCIMSFKPIVCFKVIVIVEVSPLPPNNRISVCHCLKLQSKTFFHKKPNLYIKSFGKSLVPSGFNCSKLRMRWFEFMSELSINLKSFCWYLRIKNNIHHIPSCSIDILLLPDHS